MSIDTDTTHLTKLQIFYQINELRASLDKPALAEYKAYDLSKVQLLELLDLEHQDYEDMTNDADPQHISVIEIIEEVTVGPESSMEPEVAEVAEVTEVTEAAEEAPRTILASPYSARHCRICDTWIYTAGGPFAEGDRTKTLADFIHWNDKHRDPEDTSDVVGFPFMRFNQEPVEAVLPPNVTGVKKPKAAKVSKRAPKYNEQGHRRCGHCGEYFPVEAFGNYKLAADGLAVYTKACTAEYLREKKAAGK